MSNTPLLDQYYKIKSEYPDALLFFRMGDFYEMFDEDAKIASEVLGIALTSRDHGGETRTPLAGVPHHAAERYLVKLLEAGYKVAICEQVEDPKLAKGLVRREVVEVMTPGTLTVALPDETKSKNYLLSIFPTPYGYSIAGADILTGEFFTKDIGAGELESELMILAPKEILVPANPPEQLVERLKGQRITYYEEWKFGREYTESLLKEHLGVATLEGIGDITDGEIRASGAILSYLRELKKGTLSHLKRLSTGRFGDYMFLDPSTLRNLELAETILEGTKRGSLYGTLDYTKTPMGSRYLRFSILRPLLDKHEIKKRLDAIEDLIRNQRALNFIREELAGIGDLERLVGKIGCSRANPREIYELSLALEHIPKIKELLSQCTSILLQELNSALEDLREIREEIKSKIRADAPLQINEGGIIRDGVIGELDELRRLTFNSQSVLKDMENGLRQELGIPTLKVGYNKVFGYFIEVSKSYVDKVPEGFTRKQTLVGGERFITPELKELEYKILSARERACAIEREYFLALRERIAGEALRLKSVAEILAKLDFICSLAYVAIRRRFVKPTIREDGVIKIEEGRHPVVEEIIGERAFVPNDTYLSNDTDQLLIITGPNMSGKSTYLRQVGLIVLMAHIGSYVPAKSAEISLVDRIFTRVGAWDNIARGQSTFMLEMLETSNILNNATPLSLVLLDEIGRGTSTYDGLAIAWAVAEYLHETPSRQAKTIFATHYHELTELAKYLPRVKNYQVMVRHQGGRILFLHKISPGGCDDSYGIYVAGLAGLPREAIERAKEILNTLEAISNSSDAISGLKIQPKKSERRDGIRLSLFEPQYHPIVQELKQLDLNNLKPIEALLLLKKWKEKWRL